MVKAVLFDMDGVLTFRERNFSVAYIEKHNLKPAPVMDFFATEWHNYVLGKKDLKAHIAAHPDIWQWHGTPEELMQYWFKSEDNKNEPLLKVIGHLRQSGIKCYIATEQEKYRTQYVNEVMFPNEFDGCFSTCEIGVKKSNPKYFETVMELLQQTNPGITPGDIVYFDDDTDKLESARAVGINGELYESPQQAAHLLDR